MAGRAKLTKTRYDHFALEGDAMLQAPCADAGARSQAASSATAHVPQQGSVSDEVWLLAADRMMARALEVNRWVEIFATHGVCLVPKLVSELRLWATGKGLALRDHLGNEVTPPRLCICRVYERYAPRHLELMGTICQPSAAMVDLCYDKALVAQLVAGAGVPMIASEVVPDFSSELAEAGRISLPAVLKPTSGRGGAGVELAHDDGELVYHLDGLVGSAGLVQPLVDPGHDVRVYVIGGEPRYAMERIGKPGDFRSNYSTGGTARPYKLDAMLAGYARAVLAALPESLSFGSVDFCFDHGSPVFCEVNANLGCHIPYEYGGFDLIGDYADWLREECL